MSDSLKFVEVGDFSSRWTKTQGSSHDLDRVKRDIERIGSKKTPIYVNVREIRARIGKKGKSGGARVAYFLHDEARCVYLFACYNRRKYSRFSRDELKLLNELCERIKREYKE